MSSHRVNPSTEVIIRRRIQALAGAIRRSLAAYCAERATLPPAQNIQAQRAHEEDA